MLRTCVQPLKDVECCIVMNEWDEFKKLKAHDFTGRMNTPNVVDARRIFDPEEFQDVRLVATGLGENILEVPNQNPG